MLLSACGGGGGGGGESSAPAPADTTPPPLSAQCQTHSVARLAQDAAPKAGRNTEIALLACTSGELSQLRWTQTSGASLPLLSARSQAVTLEPTAAGSYGFTVAYTDAAGRSVTAPVQLTVAADASLPVTLRGEPSVYANGQLSLRAWVPGLSESELAGASVAWSRVDGPAASLGSASGWSLVFNAPVVSVDSLLRLRATVTLADGRSGSGEFALLVQAPLAAPPADPLFAADNPVSRTYVYRPQSAHAQALAECVYSRALSRSSPNNLCTLGRLPLLGQSGATPTVEQVMDRVLVSNDWMGEVFERFLREQDVHGDFRRMLASVTAVVIGGRVRPAFYWNATGAIYLDAANLWLTPEQRDTISEAADPRSSNGALLGYAMPWRYVKDNRHAVTSYAVAQRGSRTLAELTPSLGQLLYHELTHAADFLPPRVHATLSGSLRVYEASPSLTASQDLFNRLPFSSSVMQGLARVLSFGDAPTAQQQAYTPADITRLFSADRVNDDYSYSVASGAAFSREDAAMLVEEGLMQLRYGVLRDVAVTDKLPAGGNSADLRVDWGQRGRIGEASIKPRLKLVLAEVMPWVDPALVDTLAAPLALRAGQSWGQNLDLSAPAGRALSAQQRFNEQEQTTRELLKRAR